MSAFTLIELLVVIAVIAIIAAILFPVFAKVREKARQTACLSNLKQIGLSILQYTQDYDENYPLSSYSTSSGTVTWRGLTFPYTKSLRVYSCPSNPDNTFPAVGDDPLEFPISYGANETVMGSSNPFANHRTVSMSYVQNPAQVFLIGESSSAAWVLHYLPQSGPPPLPAGPNDPQADPMCLQCYFGSVNAHSELYAGHTGLGNWLFVDGHAKALRPSQTCRTTNFWDVDSSNSGQLCSDVTLAPLVSRLAGNDAYWSDTTTP